MRELSLDNMVATRGAELSEMLGPWSCFHQASGPGPPWADVLGLRLDVLEEEGRPPSHRDPVQCWCWRGEVHFQLSKSEYSCVNLSPSLPLATTPQPDNRPGTLKQIVEHLITRPSPSPSTKSKPESLEGKRNLDSGLSLKSYEIVKPRPQTPKPQSQNPKTQNQGALGWH